MSDIDWGDKEPLEMPNGIGPVRAGWTITKTGDDGRSWVPCDLPGWEAFEVLALVEIIDGQPCVTGVKVEPKSRGEAPCLTQTKLREIPLREIADYAVRILGLSEATGARARMEEAAAEGPEPEDPRAATTAKQAAEIYRQAKLAGSLSPRQDVATALGLHVRTASKYIQHAREQGLLPPANRKGNK